MARRVNVSEGSTAPAEEEAVTGMPEGGAPGVIDDASKTIHEPGKPVASVAAAEFVHPKQYRVVNGGAVMHANCRTFLKPGKLVDEANFDLELLKRQGIILEEVK